MHVQGTPGLTVTASITEPLCFGDANGSIDVEIEGGTPPYSCAWAIPSTDPNGLSQQIDPSLVNNCDLNNITAGTYFLLVEDANGCTATQTFTVGQNDPVELDVILTYPICGGQPNACAYWGGGTGEYQVFVFQGPIISPLPVEPEILVDPTGNVSVTDLEPSTDLLPIPYPNPWTTDTVRCANGVADGHYLVVVVDSNGCYDYQWVHVQGTEGLSINLDFDQYGAYACANPSGGTPLYMVTWSDLSGNLQFPAISQECVYELPEGIYSVTVTDANGCIETEIFIIDPLPCTPGIAEVLPDEIWSGMNTTFHLSSWSGDAIQWQFRTEFTPWLDVPNGTTEEFTTPPIYVASEKEIGVRARVTCADGSIHYSNVAILTVHVLEQFQFIAPPDPELFGVVEYTSVNDLELDAEFSVYPSPTTGLVNLVSDKDHSELEISVMDLNGKTVLHTGHQQTIAGQRINLDLTGRTPGLYMIHMRYEHGMRTERIILR